MTSTPYPIPRNTRETTVLVGNGTTGPYGPTSFKVFDVDDVAVWARAEDETVFFDVTADVTVAKTADLGLDTVSVTFDTAVPATTEFVIQVRRTAERSIAITKGGTLATDQLEKELSKIASAQSELRRDVDRAVRVNPGAAAITILAGTADITPKFDADGNLVPGPSVAEIAAAEGHAAEASRLHDAILAAIAAAALVNIKWFGAKGDGKYGTGAATAGDATFTCASNPFVAADVGKLIRIDGAGAAGAKLVTTIASLNSAGSVELADAPATTNAAAAFTYGTDDTAAIDLAFATIAAASVQLYSTATQRNIIALNNPVTLDWTGGYYLYNGAGFSPETAGARVISIRGAGSSNATVEICSDVYLIDCPEAWVVGFNFLWITGLKVCGGKGLFLNRSTYDNVLGGGGGGVPQAGYYLHDVRILDFSEVGFGSYWEGTANWSITYCWIETTRPNTKGLLLGPQVANPALSGTTIVGCTYKIVFLPVGQSSTFIQNLAYLHSLPTDDHEADIWFMAIDTATEGYANVGYGVIVRDNRFSNEYRNNKPVFLVADHDDGGDPATAIHLRRHSTAATSKVFRDISIIGNVVGGAGMADTAGPLIQSYTQELGRLVVRDNALGNTFTYLLQLETAPAGGYLSDAVFGPNDYYGGGGEKPLPCNYAIGIWRDAYAGEEIPSPGTPLPGSGGYDVNYKLMSAVVSDPVDEDELTLAGGVTRAATTDALGGTNAREYTFTEANTADYVTIPIGAVDSDPYGNVYVEFDVKQAASQAMTEIDVEIKPAFTGGGETIRRAIKPTAEWLPVRIPVNANAALTSMTVRLYASPDDFSAGVRDKVQIGRPHVYRANRPVNRDHLFVANHEWSAGREQLQGPEAGQTFTRWIDWTNSAMRAKFGSPASESDTAGLLIPMMAGGGAGVSFAPTIAGGTSAGAGTYTANEARYFKLGKLVIGVGRLIWTAHTGTGTMKIILTGLPNCRNAAGSRGAFWPIFFNNMSLTAGTTLAGYVNHGTNEIILTERGNTGDALIAAMDTAADIYFAFAYEAE